MSKRENLSPGIEFPQANENFFFFFFCSMMLQSPTAQCKSKIKQWMSSGPVKHSEAIVWRKLPAGPSGLAKPLSGTPFLGRDPQI